MHPRNLHNHGYSFEVLVKTFPELARYTLNKFGKTSIDFANPKAVKALNGALLKHFYSIQSWDIPEGYLCPPVPGRADYIHHVADLLAQGNDISTGKPIVGLDIGVGANLIYPIVGSQVYGWRFVGSDIDKISIKSAQLIVDANSSLHSKVTLRHQVNPDNLFKGIIQPKDQFAFSLCNPPFHASAKEATQGSKQKNRNLAKHKQKKQDVTSRNRDDTKLNFAGQANELWCRGGELAFVKRMIDESQEFAHQVTWFTSLVSKKDNLKPLYRQLSRTSASDVRTIKMEQGNKVSRFIAWQF